MLSEALDILHPHEIPVDALLTEWIPAGRAAHWDIRCLHSPGVISSASMASELAARLSEAPPVGAPFNSENAQPEDLAHDAYFSIRRVVNEQESVFVRMAIAARLIFLREVDEAPVTISHQSLRLIDMAFCDLLSCLAGGGVNQSSPIDIWVSRGVIPRPMRRWVRGHQIFAALTQGLIFSFEAIGRALRSGSREQAQRWADLSVSLLNGSAAAFEFTGDFPAEEYQKTVRPSMAPPATEMSLSGLMSVDHRFMAQVIRDMRPALKSLYEHEQKRHDAISVALSGVYDSHIHVCERFVGAKPSILTEGKTARSGPSLIEQFKTLRMKPFEQPVRTPRLAGDVQQGNKASCPFNN